MEGFDELFTQKIHEAVEAYLETRSIAPSEPVLIRLDEARAILGVSEWKFATMKKEEGFPILYLSERVVRVDKARLLRWMANKPAIAEAA